jgi:hypothetical protein
MRREMLRLGRVVLGVQGRLGRSRVWGCARARRVEVLVDAHSDRRCGAGRGDGVPRNVVEHCDAPRLALKDTDGVNAVTNAMRMVQAEVARKEVAI